MHWEKYKVDKKVTEKALRQSHLDYINGILQTNLDERNSKPFRKYIKSLKKSIASSIFGNEYSAIGKLHITKLLQNINASKSSGPDHIPSRLLRVLQ